MNRKYTIVRIFPKASNFLWWRESHEVTRYHRGEVSHSVEIAYGVTSLKQEQASAERLLELNRGHWEIENRVHHVRNVTYDEGKKIGEIRKVEWLMVQDSGIGNKNPSKNIKTPDLSKIMGCHSKWIWWRKKKE